MSKDINRTKFLRVLGGGALASTAILAGCNPDNKRSLIGGNVKDEDVPVGKMTYRTNHNTGDKVSILGYGQMRLPMNDDNADEVDQDMVNKLTDYALAHGVNYFDTSPVYTQGLSEPAIGTALSRHPRKSYYVATKMSNFAPDDRSFEKSVEMYHNSMKLIKVEYIDYYLLHAVGNMDEFKSRFLDNGLLDYLVKERKAGRIRNLGWSFHGEKSFFDYMLKRPEHWEFVQREMNYVDWEHASEGNVNADYLYGELAKRDIPAVVMEPLLGGRLAKLNYFSSQLLLNIDPESHPAQWAFRYAGSFPDVLTVLSGMTYMENLQDNICTYSPLKLVTESDKKVLAKVAEYMMKLPIIPCTGCQYCMPCPYGLDIPAIFAHYNKCVNDGNAPKDTMDKNYREQRQAFLIGYDRSVPKLRQADHCIGCHKCEPHCPQHIRIPDEMGRIDKYVDELKSNH